MYSLSEVCEKYGTYRQEMQRLAKNGLVTPSIIDSNGYWYYDEYAIYRLCNVQIYHELGYSYPKIKNIMKTNQNPKKERERLITELESQKKIINGQIKYLQSFDSDCDFDPLVYPKSIIDRMTVKHIELPLSPRDLMRRYSKLECQKNLNQRKNRNIEQIAWEVGNAVIAMGMIYLLNEYSPNSTEIQECLSNLEANITCTYIDENDVESPGCVRTMLDVLMYFLLCTDTIYNTNEIILIYDETHVNHEIDDIFGKGAIEFIVDALVYYTIPTTTKITHNIGRLTVQIREQ